MCQSGTHLAQCKREREREHNVSNKQQATNGVNVSYTRVNTEPHTSDASSHSSVPPAQARSTRSKYVSNYV